MAIQLASVALGGYTAGLETAAGTSVLSTADVIISQAGFAAINSGLDPKAVLVAAATAGLGGPLHNLTNFSPVLGIAAHGVVGGVASEVLGGGFAEGFIGAGVGKAITVGTAGFFNAPPGVFDAGHFAVTVGGAALAAELAGGDPLWAASQAAVGYVSNQLAPRLVPAPSSLGFPRGTMLPKSAVETMVKHQNQVNKSVPTTRSPHVPPSSSNSGRQSFGEKVGDALQNIQDYFGSGAGVTASQCPQGFQCI